MDCEIRFLNEQGKLSCSLWADFISEQAAVRYARAVMSVGACKRYVSAEVCQGDHQYLLRVARQDKPMGPSGYGSVRSGNDGGRAHI